jgi:hypothetical protein
MWTYRLPSQVLFPLRLRCEGCYLSLSEARQVRLSCRKSSRRNVRTNESIVGGLESTAKLNATYGQRLRPLSAGRQSNSVQFISTQCLSFQSVFSS